jgi:hypothetical protein
VDAFDEGLRCQDVHSGLRNVDPHSSLLAPLVETRIVGMAATIAGLIRGRDVIADAQSLMTVAADQLDVDRLRARNRPGLCQSGSAATCNLSRTFPASSPQAHIVPCGVDEQPKPVPLG